MRETRLTMHAEPNVTPFLDVLLVLLILFMYLCLSQQKMITAQLPDPSARAMDGEPSIVLEVRPNAMLVDVARGAGVVAIGLASGR